MLDLVGWIAARPQLKQFCIELALSLPKPASLYLVGGAVRDLLRSQALPKDIDFLVDLAVESEIVSALQGLKDRRILAFYNQVGKSFPVFKIKLKGEKNMMDLALARTERTTGPGHRDFLIEATRISVRDDASRRDFTVNAMSLKVIPEPVFVLEIQDFFGGLGDLAQNTLRAVGDADSRFREDPLRILRALRFMIQKGFVLAPDLAQAIRSLSHELLPHLSQNRIVEEFVLAYRASARKTLKAYKEYNVLHLCFPLLEPYWPMESEWDYLANAQSLEIELALLFAPSILAGNLTARQLQEAMLQSILPYPHEVRQILEGLKKLLDRHLTPYPMALQNKIMNSAYGSQICLTYALLHPSLPPLPILPQIELLDGQDLLRAGIKPGLGFEEHLLNARQMQYEGQNPLQILQKLKK